ncbi:MAG: hypothetical protein H6861_04790 [Rhodospirillales bacterium]|nr:hypothetical protein [Rhodospirillales bacterium]
MTATKSILSVSALAFALMFGGGVYLFTQLGTLAKPLAERVASDAMGVPVRIGGLDIALKEKRVVARNIQVANPEGFSKPQAVSIDVIDITLRSVSKELIDFETITVNGTQTFLEVTPQATNLHRLKAGMKGAKSEGAQGESLKVIIRKFVLDGAQVNPSVTLLKAQELQAVKVAPVRLNGIGVKENGILAREAVKQVMAPVLETFSQAAGDAGLYQGMSPDALREMGMGQFEAIKEQFRQDIDNLGENLKKIFD